MLIRCSSDGYGCQEYESRLEECQFFELQCSRPCLSCQLSVVQVQTGANRTVTHQAAFASMRLHGARFRINDNWVRGLNLTCLDLAERPAERVER